MTTGGAILVGLVVGALAGAALVYLCDLDDDGGAP